MSDQRILDFGEVIAFEDAADKNVIGVVLRTDGAAIRFRLVAVQAEDNDDGTEWQIVEKPDCDVLMIMHPGDEPSILIEAEVAYSVFGMNVQAFREWWSGKPAGRR